MTVDQKGIIIFDHDARRSGPTTHLVRLGTLVQNLLEIHGNLSLTLRNLMRPPGGYWEATGKLPRGHWEAIWRPKIVFVEWWVKIKLKQS